MKIVNNQAVILKLVKKKQKQNLKVLNSYTQLYRERWHSNYHHNLFIIKQTTNQTFLT